MGESVEGGKVREAGYKFKTSTTEVCGTLVDL